MSSFLSDFYYPIYNSLSTKEEYVCKNDIFNYYRSQFEGISRKYNTALPMEARKLCDSYGKNLAGTCEFVPLSEWLTARRKYEDIKKMGSSNKNLINAVCHQGIRYDCGILVKAIEDIMKNHPELLTSYSEGNKLKAVRLFKEGKNSFAMSDELVHAAAGILNKRSPMVNVETVDFRDVLQSAKFCKFEILVTNLNSSFIFTPNGRRCKFPEIVLIEVVVFVVLRKRIFDQKFEATQKTLEKFGSVIRGIFPFQNKQRFFMTENSIQMIKNAVSEVCRDIQHEKKKTLTVGSVDRELAYFASLFPEFMEFFHNHNGCALLTVNRCPHCPVKPTVDFEQEAMEMMEELEKTANSSTIPILDSEPTSSEEDSGEKTTTARRKKKKKKKVVKTPKMPETSDCELSESTESSETPQIMETSDVLKVSETSVSSDSADSANSSEKSDTEPEDLPIKTVESTSDCRKCFRTSGYCEKAKEQLKTSQNTVKRLEKKQSEMEKLMESMKKKMQEEMDALRLQLEEIKNTNEQHRLENQKRIEELKKENGELKEENSKLKEAVKEDEPQPTEPEVSEPPMTREERREMIFDLRNKENELRSSNLWKDADLKVLKLISTKPDVQKIAQNEHINFKIQFNTYEEAIQTALQAILSNDKITHSQVPALPVYPALSERFKTEYNKMLVDEKNKELENECFCLEPLDEKDHENLFTCPACNKSNHLECTEEWFKKNPTCPCCRAEWK